LYGFRSEKGAGIIHIYDGRGTKEPLHTIEKLHKSTVHVMAVRTLIFSPNPSLMWD